MNTISIQIICIVLFIAHWWMMLFAKQNLGTRKTDRSFDPLYSRYTSITAFLSLLFLQGLAMAREFLLLEKNWPPSSIDQNRFIGGLIQLADAGGLTPQLPLVLAAALVFLLGFALRLWAIRILGRLFTFEIGIRDNHKIIIEGPYRFIRHPSYSGYLLMVIGLGLAFGSLGILAIIFSGTCVFFMLRIRSEEKMLEKYFGVEYSRYQQQTKRLIPFVF